MRTRLGWASSIAMCLALTACGDGTSDDAGASMDGSIGADGSTTGMDGSARDGSTVGDDGSTGMDGSTGLDGSTVGPDGSIIGPDGSTSLDGSAPSGPIMCQAHLYACGNTLDDDGDGLTDDMDPDCLGPCDNNEGGFYLDIPGGDSAPCRLDCYFDQDEGSGTDGCEWDHRCDPLEPDENPMCSFRDPPPPSASCPSSQDPRCETTCGPLVPNGCDCFGCCNLPAGGDRYVFIGSLDPDGTPSCTLDRMLDDEACHPCTPVAACLNPCGPCELCLGRTELPPECFPPPPTPDAGVPFDAGPPPDGGFPDAGVPDAGPPPPPLLCEDGRQACGLPGLPACSTGSFCLTGCCTFFG